MLRLLSAILLLAAALQPVAAQPSLPDAVVASPGSALNVSSVGAETQLALSSGLVFHQTRGQVSDARLIGLEDSPALVICWEEAAAGGAVESYYAISTDGRTIATVRPADYGLKLRAAAFDPLAGEPTVAAGLAADAATLIHIVQFVSQPLPEFRTAIEARGGKVYKYLPDYAYVVKMTAEVRDAVAALPFVRWIGPYHAAYRVEEELRTRPVEGEPQAARRYNIQVFEAGPDQKNAVAERIEASGGLVEVRNAGKFLLRATLTAEQVRAVAHWDEVAFVDRWGPGGADMDIIRGVGGANYLESVAGFTGAGVRGEILDFAFNFEHVDFASRPLIRHTACSDGGHGASCSGIIFGDGTGDATARGLCPEGQGITARWSAYEAGSRYDYTAELLEAPYFAVFQTASVGGDWTLDYTTTSAEMDTMLFDLDIVHCQSQANRGTQMSRPEAWAKNMIACGGVRHYDTPQLEDDSWDGYASIGPAADGRIKPDLCFWVDYIRTVEYPGPTMYTDTFGGTSGATPTVAGHVGLFFQMWSEGVFGNEVDPNGTVFDNRAHLSTAKAFMINSANQYPFEGADHDLTRVHQGWGRPSVQNLWDLREKVFVINETELLSQLETYSTTLVVGPVEPALRCTLVYTDPAGLPSSAQHRINDLSLRVTSPSGVIYWGNNGLLSGNWSQPGGVANTIDTVENVFVPAPEPGPWGVEVIAAEINEDSHVETPEVDADFALVVTGVARTALSIDLPDGLPAYLAPGEPTSITVRIRDAGEAYVPGSGRLHYAYDGSEFQARLLNDLGSGMYEAVLPPAACSATPRFYFSATGSGGTVIQNPAPGSAQPYTAEVGTLTVLLDDNFEQDLGWTVQNITVTDGAWQRGVPADDGVDGDPTEDYDGSGKCYLTANRAGNSDLDGGPTRLISPQLDLSDQAEVILSYARSWANDDQDDDPFDVEVSSDGGLNWVLIERVVNIEPGWIRATWSLGEFTAFTDAMQIRFSARDNPNNSIDEGAVDAVLLHGVACVDAIMRGDLNCDGLVNAFDIDPFVLALTDPEAYAVVYSGCPIQNADCNGDGLVNAFDIDPFVMCLTIGCPEAP